jgi:hypothetical protein
VAISPALPRVPWLCAEGAPTLEAEMSERRDLEERIAALEQEVARLKGRGSRSVRKRATFKLFGLPAYDIALGPDLEKGELRGHAKGFLAVGDLATGVFAIGGLARGLVALGGLAVGVVTFGGAALGLGLAIGGLAVGSIALGGGAVGGVAVGGGACGYYAVGGGAIGKYVISEERHDPEVDAFFQEHGLPLPEPRRRGPRR